MSPSEWAALVELIERLLGLAVKRGGISVELERHVTERVRALRLARVADYMALVAEPGAEQSKLIDAITVQYTLFYRDTEQLDTVARLISEMPGGPVHVWVAGCATGEEAYTIAMIGHRVGREVSVLATDINEVALVSARRGVYSAFAVRDVPPRERRWLTERDGMFTIDPRLRASISFVRHNLVDPPPVPPRGGWDLVICRNVLIYFSELERDRLLQRFARSVREGGTLVVGASEVVFEPPAGLELVSAEKRLILRRTPRPAVAPPRLAPRPVAIRAPTAPPSAPSVTPDATPTSFAPVARPANDLVAALMRGHALFERGDNAAAIAIYHELAKAHPSVAEVWLFLGIARFVHHEVEAAGEALRSSLCLDPKLWPASIYLARACERLGLRAEADQQNAVIASGELQPLALLSECALINEMRALRHDFRDAARRRLGPRRPLDA